MSPAYDGRLRFIGRGHEQQFVVITGYGASLAQDEVHAVNGEVLEVVVGR
jgi:hypothetical protein